MESHNDYSAGIHKEEAFFGLTCMHWQVGFQSGWYELAATY